MVEFAFFVMLSMWHFQDNSGVMLTPKYFACPVTEVLFDGSGSGIL